MKSVFRRFNNLFSLVKAAIIVRPFYIFAGCKQNGNAAMVRIKNANTSYNR